MKKTICLLLAVLLVAALLAGCQSKPPAPPETPAETAPETVREAPVVPSEEETTDKPEEAKEPSEAAETAEELEIAETGEKLYALIKTSKGLIKTELFPNVAPNTVLNFVTLSEKGFYNGLNFHRVEKNFVIQGGCPVGDGTGSPGYSIPAEFNERKHVEGTLAMARAAHPDSAGCQFYICLAPADFLDGQYTVFGHTVEGMDVVHSIEPGDLIESITIEGELPAVLKGREVQKSNI